MKSNKHIIASAFLILFSLMQLVDLHSVNHDDANDADCEICKLASENIDNDFVSGNITYSADIKSIPTKNILINYKDLYIDSYISFSFLNKAPPIA